MRILLIPTSDWLGHPFPSRLHHIFEKIAERNEVHVLRYAFYPEKRLETKATVHELKDASFRGLASYYIFNSSKHFRAVRNIIRENGLDALVISNLLTGYVAAKAATHYVNRVFDLSDHFPTSGAGYYFDLESLSGKLATIALEKLLKCTLKLVKTTVTCSYALLDYVKRLGIEQASVITNGVDEFFLSQNKNCGKSVREKYGLEGHVVLGYIGSIEFWLSMSPMLTAMRRLLTEGLDVKLFLVGTRLRTGTAQKMLVQMKSLGIEENVVWLSDFVPYREVPLYISAMDICTIPFNHQTPTAYYSAPNKLWEYLALGKPVIVTPIPDLIIQAHQFVDAAVTSEDYIEIVRGYMKDPDKYLQRASEAKQLVKERTWTRLAEKYEHLLRSLT